MASPETVNFVLRPNKNVERKLIADYLRRLSGFDFQQYRYIGMGSFWFADFLLFHKVLSIRDMISIEKEELASRARFNLPLGCINVVDGDTTKVLPELALAENDSIVWLDYDSDLRGPVLEDLEILCRETRPGGVIIVTVNAHPGQVGEAGANKEEGFRGIFGPAAPAVLKNTDLSHKGFPKTLAHALLNRMKHGVRRSNPENGFEVLFNFTYKDNAPMITVGGMVVNEESARTLEQCRPQTCIGVSGEEQFKIDVPPLTMAEKIALDRLLPLADVDAERVEKETNGLKLKKHQLEGYRDFYLYYPVFGELQT